MNNKAIRIRFFQYVLPTIFAFMLSGVYTIVDGFFIGNQMGDAGLAAITLAYPITALITAIGSGIGLGGAICFTMASAQKDEDETKQSLSGTFFLITAVGILVSIILLFSLNPILMVLGASGNILDLAMEYARIIAFGAIFQMLGTGLVPFIRNMGGATFATVSMICGFLTNVVLDYLFVWVFNLGMAGAAWATIAGQAVTAIFAFGYFIYKKQKIVFLRLKELVAVWGKVLIIAAAPFGLTYSPYITLIFMNKFLVIYGNEQAVAAYGCIGYITCIVLLLLQGVGDGTQPLFSEHYGKKEEAELNATKKLAYATAMIVAAISTVALLLSRNYIGILFGASGDTNTDVAKYLVWFTVPTMFLAYTKVATSCLYATAKIKQSYILSFAEPILTVLCLLILPLAFNLDGVWLAVPLAQTIAFALAVIINKSQRNRLLL